MENIIVRAETVSLLYGDVLTSIIDKLERHATRGDLYDTVRKPSIMIDAFLFPSYPSYVAMNSQ